MSRKIKADASQKDSAALRAPETSAGAARELTPQARPACAFTQAFTAPDILALQQSAGNLATQQILGAALNQPGGPPPVQAKLTLGAAGDRYEQEADRVAAEVMSNAALAEPPTAQRETDEGERVLRTESPVGHVAAGRPSAVSPALESAIGRARGGGDQSLPAGLLEQMGPRFGTSLDDVRLHTDAESHALNQAVGARAFTVGHDIFFGRGEYNPDSRDGQELIAHELTHVVQQRGAEAVGTCIQRRKILSLRQGNQEGGYAELRDVGPDGYATGMLAQLWSWKHLSEGSRPSVKPPGYPAGNDWFQRYMVQGHLLNENLGGPGNDLENLAPITKKTNSRHLHEVENLAKRLAIKKAQNIVYTVDVVPGPPDRDKFPNYPWDDQASRDYFNKLPRGFYYVLQDQNGDERADGFVENSDV